LSPRLGTLLSLGFCSLMAMAGCSDSGSSIGGGGGGGGGGTGSGPVVSAVTVPTGTLSGDVTVTYRLSDGNGDACGIVVEFGRSATGPWAPASVIGQTSGILPGSGRTIVWDSAADLFGVDATDLYIRITPDDGTAYAGTAGTSPVFAVYNNHAPVVDVENPPDGPYIHVNVIVTFDLGDADLHSSDLTVEYRGGSAGLTWKPATVTSAADITDLRPRSERTFAWAATTDEAGHCGNDYQLRLTPTDELGKAGTPAVTGTFIADYVPGGGNVQLFACGRNNFGQLGDGSTANSNSPGDVPGVTDIKCVAAGYYHTVVVGQGAHLGQEHRGPARRRDNHQQPGPGERDPPHRLEGGRRRGGQPAHPGRRRERRHLRGHGLGRQHPRAAGQRHQHQQPHPGHREPAGRAHLDGGRRR